jgi:hypothetical protein
LIKLALAAAALCAIVLAAALAWRGSGSNDGPRAVYVDQLGATYPNEALATEARTLLESAGYSVDYVPPRDVDVDFYRGLPGRGYDLVVLRTHLARLQPTWTNVNGARIAGTTPKSSLFTNERFIATKHRDDIDALRLYSVRTEEIGAPTYFGISPAFMQQSTRGAFNGATVLIMGCGGPGIEALAAAFASRGADDLISWDGLVSSEHNDRALIVALTSLLAGSGADQAVAEVMREVGDDPFYASTLRAYAGAAAVQ